MLREVRLYGDLGRKFGRVHHLHVSSTAEAVRALAAIRPGFEQALIEDAPAYRVWAGSDRLTDARDLTLPVGSREVIRIAPVTAGAKSGFLGALLGIALVAAAFLTGGASIAASGFLAGGVTTTFWGSVALTMGASLVIGGISQMLAPQPKLDAGSDAETKASYVFNGPVNTTQQGACVPIGYGRLIVGSAVISAGMSAKNMLPLYGQSSPDSGGLSQFIEGAVRTNTTELQSKSYARIVDLISEGEIEGLVNGLQSIYLDETPLQNPDGSYNFENVSIVVRTGSNGQSYTYGMDDSASLIESATSIGVEVKQSTPAVRTFSNSNLSAILVTVGVPQLSKSDKTTGSLLATPLDIAIDLKTGVAGSYEEQDLKGLGSFWGKTTSRYQRTYRIPVSGAGPWSIRVRRITADSTDPYLVNKSYWDTATECIDTKLRYPNSALATMAIDAAQFQSIPTRAYDVKLLRIKVPTNYDPIARTYTGSWNGTFKTAWSDNPAWCFYDLLTNSRYGLGGFITESQVDKWALYSIAQYCDQLVPDGLGGFEPRFTCNAYLQSRTDAYKLISDMASIFRGMAFWASGSITAVQDAPATAAALYTPANVIDGMFTYSGSSAKARHTVALVTWNDLSDMGRQKVEYVEDAEGIARFGVISTEIAAIGCTSRGQASRVGRWLLYSERLETETVSFRTGVEGILARPGQLIKVADPARAGVRYGGRITSSTTSSIGIDSPVTLTAGSAYTLSTLQADGSVQERSITHSGGTLSTLSVSPAFDEAPAVSSIWMLSSATVEPQTFRVIGIREADKGTFEVAALAHDPDKYALVETGLVLQPRSYSVLGVVPATPENVTVAESLYVTSAGVRTRMLVSWSPVTSATTYAVTYQPETGNVSNEYITASTAAEFDVDEGLHTVRVWAINVLGGRSAVPATITYQVLGKVAPPDDVTGFVVARNGNTLNFAWAHVADIDLSHYEIRQGATWNTAIVIGATPGNAFSWNAPRGGQFMIKAVDTSGSYSEIEATVVAADVSNINVLVTVDEDSRGWYGPVDNAVRLGFMQPISWSSLSSWGSSTTWNATTFAGGVAVNGETPWSAYTDPWDSYTKPWIYLDPAAEGSYTTEVIDIGFVATSAVYIDNVVEVLQQMGAWETFTQPWTYYAAPEWTWQGTASGVACRFEISTSLDGITYSAWSRFAPGQYKFRYLKIRAVLSTDDLDVIPFLTGLTVRIDVPDRVVHFEDVAVTTAGATLTFSPAFVDIQTVQVTLQSATSGDRFTVTGKSATQVTVNVYDSAGSPKAGIVDVDVFGYGEKY